MTILFAWIAGLIFGVGLIVAGMADPAKVVGFLDLTGRWDPSLALVMAGAIVVASVTFEFVRAWQKSVLGLPLMIPAITLIDRRLVAGSLLFGAGWGLAGICPGPAIVLLGAGVAKGLVFVVAMLAGMGLFNLLERQRP
ncbi:DUF6691 family protein [Undibacterium sp. Rencai35W]|uniref:DUF6691 family protein n=1 Tax=Undibacterium sp. Rencai35W TaxID=3413046 RepID=UPI003BF2FCA2